MTNDSYSENVEASWSDARPSSSAVAFVKLPTIIAKYFSGSSENWHKFLDSLECTVDENYTLNYLKNHVEGKQQFQGLHWLMKLTRSV